MIILIFLLSVTSTGSRQTDSSEEVTAGKHQFSRNSSVNMCHENLVFSSMVSLISVYQMINNLK